MRKANSNGQIDADVLQCKADTLRARDTMPPYKKEKRQELKPQEGSENTTHPADAVPETSTEQATSSQDNIPKAEAKLEHAEEKKAAIPKFDLAEEIMAEQRKITAIRRKGPGKKIEAQGRERQVEPVGYAIGPPRPVPPEQEQIIAEIVARDIEKLRRGDSSGSRR